MRPDVPEALEKGLLIVASAALVDTQKADCQGTVGCYVLKPTEHHVCVPREADLDRVGVRAGDEVNHAASPKKSFAVTAPPVAKAMRPITFRSGMRSPDRYRRTVSGVTLIRAAKVCRSSDACARYS